MSPRLPLECLELVVKHASTDHRVLAALAQCNTTLFRIATPYLYYEPYSFTDGDEFRLDWNTDTWTRHLRRVRHAHLLLLYLRCAKDFRNSPRFTSTPAATQAAKDESVSEASATTIARPPSPGRIPWRRPLSKSTSTPSMRQLYASSPSSNTPPLLQTLLNSRSVTTNPNANSNATAQAQTDSLASLFRTRHINYLEYVLYVDLDTFISSCLSIMFSSASAHTTLMHPRRRRLFFQHPHVSLKRAPLAERHFIEKELLQATTHHLTTLSLSIASFMHLQELLNDTLRLMQNDDLSPCAVSTVKVFNTAGNRTGAPLSQLARLRLGGLDADLSMKVMGLVRQFFRFHALAYPGRLTEVEFEGLGDTSSLRRRTLRRDVHVQPHHHQNNVHAPAFHVNPHPITTPVVEDDFEDDDDDDMQHVIDIQEVIEHHLNQQQQQQQPQQQQQQQQQQQPQAGGLPANFVPFQLWNQPQGLAEDSPAKLIHYMRALQELKDQLEVLNLSKWGWSTFRWVELRLIPYKHLKVLKFHPKSRVRHSQGPEWLSQFSKLQELDVSIIDPHMLDWTTLEDWELLGAGDTTEENKESSTSEIQEEQENPSANKPRPTPLLHHLTLAGTVPHVLDVLQDAVTHMDKTLSTIDLSATMDGFLDGRETLQLQSWALCLTTLDQLVVLRLSGHLALTFQAPLLLETCPKLKELSLSILTYSSSCLFAREVDHCVVPKFLRDEDDEDITLAGLKVLALEGAWVVRPQDLALVARKLPGLIDLSLMGCRFFAAGAEDPHSSAHVGLSDMIQALEPMLRKLKIHRRGVEGPLDASVRLDGYRKDDRAQKQSAHTRTPTTSTTKNQEPTQDKVMAFKLRFPSVHVMIVEKQNENSFVIPIQGPLLAALNGTMTWANYLRASSSMPDLNSSDNGDPPGAANGVPHPHVIIDGERAWGDVPRRRRFFSSRRFLPGHPLASTRRWKFAFQRAWWRFAGGRMPMPPMPPLPTFPRPQFPVPPVPVSTIPEKLGPESTSTLVISRTFESLSPKSSLKPDEEGTAKSRKGIWRRDTKKQY
ncbi:hypothetical protein BGZ82_002849 [Podila clonocystis]|nr:hypothetical protein BGZ82_002849 [Podila clonocystis]